jgi:hypothetical protein
MEERYRTVRDQERSLVRGQININLCRHPFSLSPRQRSISELRSRDVHRRVANETVGPQALAWEHPYSQYHNILLCKKMRRSWHVTSISGVSDVKDWCRHVRIDATDVSAAAETPKLAFGVYSSVFLFITAPLPRMLMIIYHCYMSQTRPRHPASNSKHTAYHMSHLRMLCIPEAGRISARMEAEFDPQRLQDPSSMKWRLSLAPFSRQTSSTCVENSISKIWAPINFPSCWETSSIRSLRTRLAF